MPLLLYDPPTRPVHGPTATVAGDPPEGARSEGRTARLRAQIRPGRLSDVPRLVELYLGQTPESRGFYHPYPFRRGILNALFTYMVLERRFSRGLLHLAPRAAVVLLVANRPGDRRPVGYCTVRFVHDADGPVKALFGSLVSADAQGMGVGGALLTGAIGVTRAHGLRYLTTTFLGSNRVSADWVRSRGFVITPTAPDLRRLGEPNFIGELDLWTQGPVASGSGPELVSVSTAR